LFLIGLQGLFALRELRDEPPYLLAQFSVFQQEALGFQP
tara:strand:+ start:162 stop:278 length:117 start_codon:yes stop_codon:yes gene_type:complete